MGAWTLKERHQVSLGLKVYKSYLVRASSLYMATIWGYLEQWAEARLQDCCLIKTVAGLTRAGNEANYPLPISPS